MDYALEQGGPTFQDEVDKQILHEAPASAWHHPHEGEIVSVEIGREGDASETQAVHSWRVGAGVPCKVGGVDIDRSVRTMRRGEVATVKARQLTSPPARLQLTALERVEDILAAGRAVSDGRLVRTTIQEGAGYQTPKLGSELRVRFCWRVAPPAAKPASAQAEAKLITIFIGGPADQWDVLGKSHELAALRRDLLRQHSGTIVVQGDPDQVHDPTLRIVRDGITLHSGVGGLAGLAQACAAIEDAPFGQAREIVMRLEEGEMACSAKDWIPGLAGLRVVADMKVGQRCLVRVDPELAFGAPGLPEHGVPPEASLEYSVEVLEIMTWEDVSLDSRGGVMKKVTREGEGYDRPIESAEVTVRLEARDDISGAVLLEEREVKFSVGSGKYCVAVDETVINMKKGEACEVRCTDASACTDLDLHLQPAADAVVVLSLELLDFEKVDFYNLEEPARVALCAGRKEVGSKMFQAGNSRRALKRYKYVTNALAYLDHWKDAAAKDEATQLRRVCHLNSAACWLKLEIWAEAEKSCTVVLKDDPDNVKALFRRGRAFKETGELRSAERDLRKVQELDPENKEAARMRLQLRQALKGEAEQEKKMFSRMAKGIRRTEGSQDAGEAEPSSPSAPSATAAASAPKQEQATTAEQLAPTAESEGFDWISLGMVVLAGISVGAAVWLARQRRATNFQWLSP